MTVEISRRVSVGTEPLTYRQHGEYSYFRDAFQARFLRDQDAVARIERHGSEMRTELRARLNRSTPTRYRGDQVTFEHRAVTLDPGSGGYSVPPLWLVDRLAEAPRPERVVSALVPTFDLPSGVFSVNIPVLTTGNSEAVSAPSTVSPATDLVDSATSSRAVLISGHVDAPIQMFEQSPVGAGAFDQVMFHDLLSALDAQVETQVINGAGGTGANAQLPGILTVTGTGSVTYTSGSPTAIGAYPYVGQTLGLVATNRKRKPQILAMRFGRWVWFTTSEDDDHRPLGVPDAHTPAPITPDGVPDPSGALVNVPVFCSESIPVNLGTTGTEDVVIAMRPSDTILFAGTPTLSLFNETLSGSLDVRLQLRAYYAWLPGRFPSSIAILGGTGLAVQTDE